MREEWKLKVLCNETLYSHELVHLLWAPNLGPCDPKLGVLTTWPPICYHFFEEFFVLFLFETKILSNQGKK